MTGVQTGHIPDRLDRARGRWPVKPRSADYFHCAPAEGNFPHFVEGESVRPDPRALDGLRSKGEGRMTRINDILTNLMDAERRVDSGR